MALAATPPQTIGPFFHMGLDVPGPEQLVPPDHPGAVHMAGRLFDGAGEPISDGLIEIWDGKHFGRCATDADGRYHFTVTKPEPASANEAPHLDVMVFARGLLDRLFTRMYFPGEGANASDPVLRLVTDPAARQTLIAVREQGALRFDIHLQGDKETVFFTI